MPDYRNSSGFLYLEGTKLQRDAIFEAKRENISETSPFKVYPDAKKVLIPRPVKPLKDVWQCFEERRSVRKYSRRPLPLEYLSSLLWASQGVTAIHGRYLFRTAPSAGALYPIETYLCVNDCLSLQQGLYHYEVASAGLELMVDGDFGQELTLAALGQNMCNKAPVVFIWSAISRRTMSKYGSRGMRYVFMDVAHICENLLLAASALGLGACPIGAFFDDELNSLLGLDGIDETVVYMASVGFPK